MNLKEALVGLVVTIVGGVVVFWATNGYLAERQRETDRVAQVERERDKERVRVEAERVRREDQARIDAERRRLDEEKRAQEPKMSELEMDINRDGSDYKDFVAGNVQDCLDACRKDGDCRAITFTKASRQCWMKNVVPLRSNNSSYISAVKR